MSDANYGYRSHKEWRDAAMQRPDSADKAESEQRRVQADTHNKTHDITDSDTLADQQLYILGKMDMNEYQAYLLFKHTDAG